MATRRRSGTTAVYLELGTSKVFACAADWPGWCRSGKTEEDALEALAAYASRYAVVAKRAGVPFTATAASSFDIVERVTGNATTDFGAPGIPAELDFEKVTPAAAKRQGALVAAAWSLFDDVAAKAPAVLRKGPRGGGRDRDKMIDHVLDAEGAYARKIGIKPPKPSDDQAEAQLREMILAVVGATSDGRPIGEKGWPVRYAARRIAWHVLDHAWEMQDRSKP
jgi:hypothetical protein